jgi:glucose-6-phosphate isomerase
MLCQAFPGSAQAPEVHFISSVDAWERERLLAAIDPRETAIILVSKSFTTSEVLSHARLRQWQNSALEPQESVQRLFAVTAAVDKAVAFGVPESQVMQMGEWTGGRYSLWSPVSLAAAISMGPPAFDQLCAGGASMDRHFREALPVDNLPLIHGLLSCWHRNVCNYSCRGLALCQPSAGFAHESAGANGVQRKIGQSEENPC